MILPSLSHHDAVTSWCMGSAFRISITKVDLESSMILEYYIAFFSDIATAMSISVCLFFTFSIIFTFQSSTSASAGCDHSGFREIIFDSLSLGSQVRFHGLYCLLVIPVCCHNGFWFSGQSIRHHIPCSKNDLFLPIRLLKSFLRCFQIICFNHYLSAQHFFHCQTVFQ